ncbi:MAG: transaldolase [Gemmataceae bacterium]
MRIGIATDHGGFDMKNQLIAALRQVGHEVIDFGATALDPGDDYPDFVIPLARAVAAGDVQRGIVCCGSGVGASVTVNKIPGVRAGLCHDHFSAKQGVEDDDMNILCLGGRVIGFSAAWDHVEAFLTARFSGAERHRRRLAKVATLEKEGHPALSDNPLVRLHSLGQSIWLDFIRRDMLGDGGTLQQLIANDELRGVTSNPAIFEKAIDDSTAYDEAIRALAQAGKSVPQIYETLTVQDVQRAADLFRGVYDKTRGRDGYVSLEVSPKLAHDTEGTIAEAQRLWEELNRPNVLIKVPATQEGLPVIQHLISEGINVNVTLLFAVPRYQEVANAYMSGLEARVAAGRPVDRIASVASFFLSRIDVLIDPLLEKMIEEGSAKAELTKPMHGEIAIASARMAYQLYKELYASDRWRKLAKYGAKSQRLLWASTSTKNPKYSDVLYVEALIGPDTVNTVPPETLDAYRRHGQPAIRLEEQLEQCQRWLRQLADVGIDLTAATRQLEDEGVHKFIVPFDKLLATLEAKRAAVMKQA